MKRQRSQYIHMQVIIIRMRVLFEGGSYMRKYGMYLNDQTDQLLRITN